MCVYAHVSTIRLKFTVVSEPMDDEEECVDVGHAFLDLQELLLTGNDVIERQIDSRCCYGFVTFVITLLFHFLLIFGNMDKVETC